MHIKKEWNAAKNWYFLNILDKTILITWKKFIYINVCFFSFLLLRNFWSSSITKRNVFYLCRVATTKLIPIFTRSTWKALAKLNNFCHKYKVAVRPLILIMFLSRGIINFRVKIKKVCLNNYGKRDLLMVQKVSKDFPKKVKRAFPEYNFPIFQFFLVFFHNSYSFWILNDFFRIIGQAILTLSNLT